jgi:hypothetical protein
MIKKLHQYKDLTGMVFGDLTVISLGKVVEDKRKDGTKYRHWVCRCLCGKTSEVRSCHLVSGHTKSCGCLQTVTKRKAGTAFRQLLYTYKNNAKDRGYAWELTDEQFLEITQSPCHYTGRLPSNKFKSSFEEYVYNGIDRKDNDAGYTLDNCLPCCAEVNMMKKDLPLDRFLELCRKVAERFPK